MSGQNLRFQPLPIRAASRCCDIAVRLGASGTPTDGVKAIYCEVLVAMRAGDESVGQIGSRLELDQNTVWKRISDMRQKHGLGYLIEFPDGLRSERRERTAGLGCGDARTTPVVLSAAGRDVADRHADRFLRDFFRSVRLIAEHFREQGVGLDELER